jgi:hypothetical protein
LPSEFLKGKGAAAKPPLPFQAPPQTKKRFQALPETAFNNLYCIKAIS